MCRYWTVCRYLAGTLRGDLDKLRILFEILAGCRNIKHVLQCIYESGAKSSVLNTFHKWKEVNIEECNHAELVALCAVVERLAVSSVRVINSNIPLEGWSMFARTLSNSNTLASLE